MQKLLLICSLFTFLNSNAQNVGIGTNIPVASAKLDVTSTNSGLLPPRMTYAQRNAIVNPASGLIIYCTDCANGEMQYYNGAAWMQMTVAAGSVPFVVPTITTTSVTAITSFTATSGGNITSDGGASVTVRGVCWSTSINPTIALSTKTADGIGTGVFASSITGLISSTTYHVRAYATNSVGTAYGGDSSFITPAIPSVTICNQIWTSKNLDVSTYRNGDTIPQVTDSTQWENLTTGAWCYYNNDASNRPFYGKLYNWYAVNDLRGLAPAGYHVPSDAEWNKLAKCIDPSADTTCQNCIQSATAGGAMKVFCCIWQSPNTGATNSSGFSALPGGHRSYNNSTNFYGVDFMGYWWSSTQQNTPNAWYRGLSSGYSGIARFSDHKTLGQSVRCLKD